MLRIRQIRALVLLIGGFTLVTGCADMTPTDPFVELALEAALGKPDKGEPGDKDQPYVLQWIEPLEQDITVQADCGYASGCTLEIPEVGAKLQIPGATLPEAMVISMTAQAGSDVNFVFGPHGTQFKKTVKVRVDQNKTDAKNGVRKFWALYWVDTLANVQEKILATIKQGAIEFETDHFSGYALAM